MKSPIELNKCKLQPIIVNIKNKKIDKHFLISCPLVTRLDKNNNLGEQRQLETTKVNEWTNDPT